MKIKIIVISATSKSNLTLSKNLGEICKRLGADVKVISLENFSLPLYTENSYKLEKEKNNATINELSELIISANGIIVCGPEYNGSIHPIITNAITWISVSTENWRDAFNGKVSLIGTSSGGGGAKFLMSMRIQLEHLGSVVMPRTITTNKSNPFNPDSSEKIIKQFISLLKY